VSKRSHKCVVPVLDTHNVTSFVFTSRIFYYNGPLNSFFFFVEGEVARRVILIESRSDKTRNNMTYRHTMYHIEKSSMRYVQ